MLSFGKNSMLYNSYNFYCAFPLIQIDFVVLKMSDIIDEY